LASAYIGFEMVFLPVVEGQAGDNDTVLLKRRARPYIIVVEKYKFLMFWLKLMLSMVLGSYFLIAISMFFAVNHI